MGCSPTKSSRVTCANNNNTTQNGGSTDPDQRGARKKSDDAETNRILRNHSRKKDPSLPVEGAKRPFQPNQPLVESIDFQNNEVFLPDDTRLQAGVPALKDECQERVQSGEPSSGPNLNVPSSPLLHGHREITRSQSEFFRMLDEKIAMGHSLSSLGSVT